MKPKKKKGSKNGGGEFSSETRATGGSGKSGGGKSGGSSSSSSDSSSSSSSSSGGGKGKKGKKGGSSGDSAVRICEGYDEDGNLIGSYPTASVKEPPPPPPSPSSDILLVPSAPSTPSSSVVNDAPTSTPNTFISDDNNFVGQESVCRAFEAGTAPTAGPRQSQTVQLTLNVVRQNDTNSNRQAIYNRMDAAFKTSLAPLLLNCASDRRLLRQEKRQLQTDNSTEYVNIVFGNMTQNTNGTIFHSVY